MREFEQTARIVEERYHKPEHQEFDLETFLPLGTLGPTFQADAVRGNVIGC